MSLKENKSIKSSNKSHKNFFFNYKEYICGWIGGIVKVIVGQPFDTIKVRIQSQSGITPQKAIRDLLQNEGPFAFYKGTLSPLIGISGIVSIQFGSCEWAKKQFKIQQTKTGGIYSGSIDAFKKITKKYGIKGLYKGFWITEIREFFGYGACYWGYEFLMRIGKQYINQESNVYRYLPLLAGSIAGPFFWANMYMFDIIKSKLQSDSFESPKYVNTLDCIKKTWQQGGFPAFWKGFMVCFARAVPVNSCVFFAYEETMKLYNNYQ